MPILKKIKYEENFTIVPNATFQNNEMTYEAKGLLIELLTRPDDWEIKKTQLLRKHTRERMLNRVIAELKNSGFLHLCDVRNKKTGAIINRTWIVGPISMNGQEIEAQIEILNKTFCTFEQNVMLTKCTNEQKAELQKKEIKDKDIKKENIKETKIAAEPAAAPAADPKPLKVKAEKASDPRVKEIHDFYLENHPLKKNYFPNFGKERKIIKNLLAVLNANGHAVEIITERLSNYFKSGFYAATGWGLESFVKNFNAFVAPQNNTNQKPVKPAKPVRKPGGGFHAITNPYED